MSAADDKSLLAMRAAKMSVTSIAMTMGWGGRAGEKRVERRLAELDSGAPPPDPATVTIRKPDGVCITKAIGLPGLSKPAPATVPERQPHTNPVRTPERMPNRTPSQPERPVRPAAERAAASVEGADAAAVAPGEGLVVRTFVLADGDMGAAVLLDGGRLVFTETGDADVKLNRPLAVTPAEGCYRAKVTARG